MGTKQVDISPGSEGATLLPEFGPAPSDVVLHRWHGVGPMGGTDLNAILRNLGVTTIVAVGVSVNIAITNLVMDAVNAGYRVVVPRDAVAGIPADYADAIIDNTISLLATVTTTVGSDSGMDVTDTSHETRGFPPIEPIDAPPEMARFMSAMRRLQDIVVSTAPDGELWTDGARRIEELCEELEVHRGAAGRRACGPGSASARASATRLCRRGHSPNTDPTASRWRAISAASTSAATTPCMAGSYPCSSTGTSA